MEQLLTGVRPVCIGLLAGVIASFCQTNYVINSAVSLPAIAIGPWIWLCCSNGS